MISKMPLGLNGHKQKQIVQLESPTNVKKKKYIKEVVGKGIWVMEVIIWRQIIP